MFLSFLACLNNVSTTTARETERKKSQTESRGMTQQTCGHAEEGVWSPCGMQTKHPVVNRLDKHGIALLFDGVRIWLSLRSL